MNTISSTEYTAEINTIASNLIEEAMLESENLEQAQEIINDHLLHEYIDGHQWVIYYAYNLAVIDNSDNPDYMVDNLGDESLAAALNQGGLDGLHTAIAFWALYADVSDKLHELYENIDSE